MTKLYDQHKAANARYQAKLKRVTIQVPPEEAAEYAEAASASGESVTSFIRGAIKMRIEHCRHGSSPEKQCDIISKSSSFGPLWIICFPSLPLGAHPENEVFLDEDALHSRVDSLRADGFSFNWL